MNELAQRVADHPWYLDLRPDPSVEGYESDASATLQALDALGAVILAVHVDTVPSLTQLMAGRSYIGWTLLVPGSIDCDTIERIAALVGGAYRATVTPGHPLPDAAHRSPTHDPIRANAIGQRPRATPSKAGTTARSDATQGRPTHDI